MRGKPLEKMRGLNEWGKEKPLGLVIVAQQLAMGIDPFSKWLKSIKFEELLGDHIIVPPLKEWISLYKDHRRLEKYLIKSFKELGGIVGYGASLAESFLEDMQYIRKLGPESLKKEFEKMSNDEWQEIKNEREKTLRKLYDFHLKDIKSEIEGGD